MKDCIKKIINGYLKIQDLHEEKYDYLDIKGNIDNLYALGTFTEPIIKTVAIQNHGVEASVTYINKYEPKLKGFHNKYVSTSTYLFRILIIILVLYYILIYKNDI